jgi:hypothetical protein
MSEPKQPEDHKPKIVRPKVVDTDDGWVVTHHGITINVERNVLDDFELLDDVSELQLDPKRGAVRVPSMLRRLAGTDGYQAVMDGLRDKKTGRVAASAAVQWVFEVIGALNPNG